jgi:hypothetical protein
MVEVPTSSQSRSSTVVAGNPQTTMIGLGLLAVAAAVVSALPSNTPLDLPINNDVKRQYYEPPPVNTDRRAQAVVDVFRTSWEGYYTYAFPMDELRPVNNSGSNSRYVSMLISTVFNHANTLSPETAGAPPPSTPSPPPSSWASAQP